MKRFRFGIDEGDAGAGGGQPPASEHALSAEDAKALRDTIASQNAELEQTRNDAKIVKVMRERVAAATAAGRTEHVAITRSILSGTDYTPEPAAPEAAAAVSTDDDLDDHTRMIVSTVTERVAAQLAKANADALATELGPLKQEVELQRMRGHTRTLLNTYGDRVTAKQDQLAALLDDPAVVKGGLDKAFREADYDDLFNENQALLAKVAEHEQAGQVEQNRRAAIARHIGPGGGGATGTAPVTDVKQKYGDSKHKMRDIFIDVLSEDVAAARA